MGCLSLAMSRTVSAACGSSRRRQPGTRRGGAPSSPDAPAAPSLSAASAGSGCSPLTPGAISPNRGPPRGCRPWLFLSARVMPRTAPAPPPAANTSISNSDILLEQPAYPRPATRPVLREHALAMASSTTMGERLVEDRIDGSSGFLILPTIFPLPVIERTAPHA